MSDAVLFRMLTGEQEHIIIDDPVNEDINRQRFFKFLVGLFFIYKIL